MRWIARAFSLAAAATLGACSTTPPPVLAAAPPAPVATPQAETRAPVTILVSIDGFRPDYLDRGATPNLNALAAAGISAAMRPSYPSKTFPNHWTIVTGLRPDRTGIVANKMKDAARPDETFTMASDDPFWWNAAEPIWVTAEKAGIRTGTGFWPGSNVAWGGEKAKEWPNELTGGVRPTDWTQFNQAISDRQRVDMAIDWLRRPAANRPQFVTLYFDEVDTAGHEYGPFDARTTAAVAAADAAIGRLREGLAALGQPANLVIVADHGMAPIADDRVIVLDKFSNVDDYDVVEDGVYASINPKPGKTATVEKALLGAHGPHLTCYRKAEVPERFHYGKNPRVPAILCMPDDGWTVVLHPPKHKVEGGAHGYDNFAPDMLALFIASGPAIRPLGKLATFDNVDIAPLLRDLLGLPAGQNLDGDDAPFRAALGK
ncbi:MAG: alkaline phosphatase family protein [Sphingomonas sp.]|uniref:nucleotide pyrophosphatase/phosphodiesterase family protein n=1 Tax=Sphingomonas sp. TaxID=28214 RepID=UPI001AC175AF|nr:nucleotide pyrophosphatase/phosphodiesterase family protein [Sphingomonas sp.]MBN8815423.1 alkaline phosphatase family protein [Sphingomonas sp.]